VKTRFAVRDPFADGVKRTVTVQLELPASDAPQLFVWAKLEALVPVIAMLEIVTAPLPVLLTVTVSGAEVTVSAVLGNVTDAGLNESAVLVPFPESAVCWGGFGPSSLKFSVAEKEPTVCGVKTTFRLQVAPAASVAPQVELLITK
jgi:hypothetical protein